MELNGLATWPVVAAIEPYYLTPSLVFAAFFSADGTYTLALLEHHVSELSEQPQLVGDGCKRAFRLPLSVPPTDEAALRAAVQAAFWKLKDAGVFGAAAR